MRLPFEKHKGDKTADSDQAHSHTSLSLERIEVTVYPNQAEEVEKIIADYQVHFIKTLAESYSIQCVHYVISAPSEMSNQIIDKLAHKIDTKQRINASLPETLNAFHWVHTLELRLTEGDLTLVAKTCQLNLAR